MDKVQMQEEEDLRNLLKVMLRKEDHELLPSDIAFLKARRDYLERPDRQRIDALNVEKVEAPKEEGKPEVANDFPANKDLDDGEVEA